MTPLTAAPQASLSFTVSRSLLKLMSIESMTPSSHLILCHPLIHLPSIFPRIRVFSNELLLHISWPKYWSFSFSISPSNDYQSWFILGLTGLTSLQPRWNCLPQIGTWTHMAGTWTQPKSYLGLKLSQNLLGTWTHMAENQTQPKPTVPCFST